MVETIEKTELEPVCVAGPALWVWIWFGLSRLGWATLFHFGR